jgi:transcriptional regulator with GAF, ATPase, and Fis domain
VRELQNVIEPVATASRGCAIQFVLPKIDSPKPSQPATSFDLKSNDEWVVVPESQMRRRERQNILPGLKKSNWRIYGIRGAVQLLGIKPTTLSSRIKIVK